MAGAWRGVFLPFVLCCISISLSKASMHEPGLPVGRTGHFEYLGESMLVGQIEDSRFAPFVTAPHNAEDASPGRKLQTNHAGAMCMHFRKVVDSIDEEREEEEVAEDFCAINFARFGDGGGQQECENPDFGGLSRCCYNGRHDTCTPCYMEPGCDEVELGKCVQRREEMDEGDGNFAVRVASCVFAPDAGKAGAQVGFWRQPGFVSPSSFSSLRGEAITTERSAAACAERCVNATGCFAFAFLAERGECAVLQHTESWAPLCPENKTYCTAGGVDVSGSGLSLAAGEAEELAREVFYRDTDGTYCAANAVECAKFRALQECMDLSGCSMSPAQAEQHVELCHGCGCTASQCGLPRVSCNATAMACALRYTDCVHSAGGLPSCSCTQEFAGCMTSAGCLDGSSEEVLGVSLADLCFSEGCSAAECGLSEVACNETAFRCNDDYLACTSSGADVCGCTRELVGCIEGTNCFSPDLRAEIFQQCKADGCSDSDCGYLPELEALACPAAQYGACSDSFKACTAAENSCGCVRELMGCLTAADCQLQEATLERLAGLCLYEGCTAQECGICEGQCNRTVVTCAEEHTVCMATANGTAEECACAAAFYGCTEAGGCMSEEVQLQHARMCYSCGCTAAECGLPPSFRMCNQTTLQCSAFLAECVHEEIDPDDKCYANYEEKKDELGEGACYDRWHGGIPGCKYNPVTDLCFTSVNCNCSLKYFQCMDNGGCVDEESTLAFARMCAADGCTAAQCGLQDALPCNYTAQVCADTYAECEVVRTSAIVEGISFDDPEIAALPPPLPGCKGSLCLRNYYQCMDGANCVSEKDLAFHRECCEAEGCTLEECGLTPIEEQQQLPVKPKSAALRSQLGNVQELTWTQSALARLWRLVGSRNYIVQYYLEYYRGCELIDVGVGMEPEINCSALNASAYATGRERSAVFGGLTIGELYRAHVFAINLYGMSIEAAITWARHFGVPGMMDPPIVERAGSFTLQVLWSLPEDTGDGTQTVPLEGYRLEVSRSGRALLPVLLEVEEEVRTLFLQTSLGGTFDLCAAQGEICFCYGVVRFGNFGVWSPPYASQGAVLCDVGPVFPDVLQEQDKICECNTGGIALERGEVLSVRVAARNELGYGPLSDPGEEKIMGVPGPVSNLEIDPGDAASDRIKVFWDIPKDTGFGELDPTAPIFGYLVVLGTCEGFRQDTEVCTIKTFDVDPASCSNVTEPACTFDILELGNLEELRVYYITVLAENEVGRGYLSQAPVRQQAWKLVPTFIVPTLDEFPLRVVEWEGESFVWWRGVALERVNLIIRNLPRLEIGAPLDVPVERGEATLLGRAEVSARVGLYDWVSLESDLGLDTATTLRFDPPVFGLGEGEATALLEFEGYDDRRLQFQLSYFEYLLAMLLRVAPTAGPREGNTVVSIEVEEDVGLETRVGAGLPNFLQATIENSFVTFNGTRAFVMDVSQITETTMRFLVVAPFLDAVGDATIRIRVNGAFIPTVQPILYTYRSEYIQSIVPASGLVTGGQEVEIIVRDAKVELQSVLVQFAGFFATNVQFAQLDGDLLVITATTPAVEQTGLVTVTVTLTDVGGLDLVLQESELFRMEPVPEPEFIDGSLRVDGEEVFGLLIPLGKEATLEFTVSFLGPSDSLQVTIGSVPATSVTWSTTGPDMDPRQSFTEVTAVLPASGLDVGAYAVTATSTDDFWGVRTATSGVELEFRDFNAGTVVALAPTTGRQAGGRVVLAGVVSFCVSGSPCPPETITARFTVDGSDFAGSVIGAVSLQSWLEQDFAYLQLVGGLRISTYLANIGGQDQAALDQVVADLERYQGELAAGNDQAVLLFFETPGVTASPEAVIADGVLSTPTGNKAATFLFEFTPDPLGPAVVESFAPELVDVRGGTGVTVRISNFVVVEDGSDVTIFVNNRQIPTDQIVVVSSTADETVITFVTNPTSEGPRNVVIYPNDQPDNIASFTLIFFDSAAPEVVYNNPEKVYLTNGGYLIARVIRFGDEGDNYFVTFVFEDSPDLEIPEFQSSYDVDTQEVSFVIPAPDVAVEGTVIVLMYNTDIQKSASFTFEYVTRPTGPAVLVVEPTTGPNSGGYSVNCYLTNFLRVYEPADVQILFNDEILDNSTITSLQSTIDETFLVFTAPALEASAIFPLKIWPRELPNNVGEAQFHVTNPLDPVVVYAYPDETDNVTLPTLVTVGIQYFQSENDETLPPNFVVGVATFGEQTAPVVVTEVLESSPAFTELIARMPTAAQFSGGGLQLPVSREVEVSLSRDVVDEPRTVTFAFTYHPLIVRVAWFRPTFYFTDGRVAMEISMLNFPEQLADPAELMVVFADPGEFNERVSANATAISYSSLPSGRFGALVDIIIPSFIMTGPVTPYVIIPSFRLDHDVLFPSPFTYRAPPDIVVASMIPSRGSISENTLVAITLQNFPGVEVEQDIRVTVGGIAAEVVEYESVAPAGTPMMALQDMLVRFRTPCCSAGVTEQSVDVEVSHVDFGYRVGSAVFSYFDPAKPQLQDVVGDFGENFVAVGEATLVSLEVENVPQAQDVSNTIVTVDGVRVEVKLVDIDENGNGVIVILVPPETSERVVEGTILFETVGETITFELQYYDDALPSVLGYSPTTGPLAGGTRVYLTLANFPTVEAENEIIILFGDGLGLASAQDITLLSSDASQTVVSLLTPGVDEPGPTRVRVKHIDFPSKEVEFFFTFQSADPVLISQSRQEAVSTGGDVITVIIDNFPPTQHEGAIGVIIDGQELDPDQYQIIVSDEDSTELAITLPNRPPGQSQIEIFPRVDGPGEAVVVTVTYVDPLQIELGSPASLPTQECAGNTGSLYLFIASVQAGATAADFTVLFDGQAITVESATVDDNNKATLTLSLPQVNAAQDSVVTISYGGFQLTTPFKWLDCDSGPVLNNPTPPEIVNDGGTVLLQFIGFNVTEETPFVIEIGGQEVTVVNAWTTEQSDGTIVGNIQIEVPPIEVDGTLEGVVSRPDGTPIVTFPITIRAPCVYEGPSGECASRGLIANLIEIENFGPTDPECDLDTYCMQQADLPVPNLVLGPLPSSGRTSGGETVTVLIDQFPFLQENDIMVLVRFPGGNEELGTVTNVEVNGLAGLFQQVQLTIAMPASPVGETTAEVQVSTTYGTVDRENLEVFFAYEYFQLLTGAAVVSFYSPREMYASESGRELAVHLSNFPIIEEGQESRVRLRVAGAEIQATALISSDRDLTKVIFTLPPPSTTLAPGDYEALVFFSAHGTSRAGSLALTVLADPDPVVTTLLPDTVQQGTTIVVTMGIQYFWDASAFSQADVSVVLAGSIAATVQSVTSADTDCASVLCSLESVIFQTPSNLPEGLVSADTCVGSGADRRCATASLNVLPISASIVTGLVPSTAVAGTSPLVMVYIRNFRPVEDLADVLVRVNQKNAEPLSLQAPSAGTDLWAMQIQFPELIEVGLLPGVIYRRQDGIARNASFEFEITRPLPVFSPIDAPITGGTLVTFTTYWQRVQASNLDLAVSFDGAVGEVKIQRSDNFVTRVEIVTPEVDEPGTYNGLLTGAGDVSEFFRFEFFEPPSISRISPDAIDLEGDEVLSLRVENFPGIQGGIQVQVETLDDFKVEFDGVVCDGTEQGGRVCEVRAYVQHYDFLDVDLVVPAGERVGPALIAVEYTGEPVPKEGGSLGDEAVVRSTRRAASRDFSYFLRQPSVLAVLYCEDCVGNQTTCIVAGLCPSGEAPRTGAVSVDGGGKLTLILEDVEVPDGGLFVPAWEPRVTIGSESAPATVIVVDAEANQVVLVVEVTEREEVGLVDASVNLPDGSDLPFRVLLRDPNIGMTCDRTTSNCASSEEGGGTVRFIVDGLPLDTPEMVDNIIVTFGEDTIAQEVIWVAPGVIDVVVPPYSSVDNKYNDGSATVPVRVEFLDGSAFVETEYTYIGAPQILESQDGARYSSDWTSLQITFDSETNAESVFPAAAVGVSCDAVFDTSKGIAALGSGAYCVGQGSRVVIMVLGQNPTIEPGDTISIVDGQRDLRSLNGLSPPSRFQEKVLLEPAELLPPGPAQLAGPSKIDACGDLELFFSVSWPRRLSYVWQCLNCGPDDQLLADYLQTVSEPHVSFPDLTPLLRSLRFEYLISAVGTDVLPTRVLTSDRRTIRVTKVESPIPSLFFSGLPSYKASRPIILKTKAKFSKCGGAPRSLVDFKWGRSSDDDGDDNSDFDAESGNLFIRPRRLRGARTYSVQVSGTVQADPSMTNDQRFDIKVVFSPLVPVISGGSTLEFSASEDLALAGTESFDPDSAATVGEDPELAYRWTCFQEIDGEEQSCRSAADYQRLEFANAGTLIIPAGTLVASPYTYVFRLFVKKASRLEQSTAVRVTVKAAAIPTIGMSKISNFINKRTGLPLLNSDSRVVQSSRRFSRGRSLGFGSLKNFRWRLSGLLENLSDIIPQGFNHAEFVVVPRRSLSKIFFPRAIYTISLSGADGSSDVAGRASSQLLLNSPPSLGTCQACEKLAGNSQFSDRGECRAQVAALVGTLAIQCTNWMDEDLPLAYAFGYRNEQGVDLLNNPVQDYYSFIVLPALPSPVTVIAQVLDAVGAKTDIQEMQVEVIEQRRRRAGGGRELLAVSEASIVTAIENLEASAQLGQVEQATQEIVALFLSLPSSVSSEAQRRAYMERIIDDLRHVTENHAALTVEYAESKAKALAEIQQHCDLTKEAALDVLHMLHHIANVDTTDDHLKEDFIEDLNAALSMAAGGTATYECGSRYAASDELSVTEVQEALLLTHEIVKESLNGLLQVYTAGEATPDASAAYFGMKAARDSPADLPGTYQVQDKLSFGTLPDDLGLPDGTYDLKVSEGYIPENSDVIFDRATFGLLSDVMFGLSVYPEGSFTEATITNLTNDKVFLRIPVSSRRTATIPLWAQRATCVEYTPETGAVSGEGCDPFAITETYVECQCDHLSIFTAAIDPNRPACGDGVISAAESCDDAESAGPTSLDGCSAACQVEDGAICWHGNAGAGPSYCCAPCPRGQFRTGCQRGVFGPRDQVVGECLPCAAGEFKSERGTYASVCEPCPANTTSLPGAHACFVPNVTTCGPGEGVEIEECVPCPEGFYSHETSTDPCFAIPNCPPGSERTNYSASSSGVCAFCPPGSYKEVFGTYTETCRQCPAGASTGGTNNVSDADVCLCGVGYGKVRDTEPFRCVNVDECAEETDTCDAASTACRDTAGSFVCDCLPAFFNETASEDVKRMCTDVCGDGLRSQAEECDDGDEEGQVDDREDGCSGLCTVEDRFVCTGGDGTQADTCECEPFWFTPNAPIMGGGCSRFCKADETCGARGDCDIPAGFCRCDRYYFGASCEVGPLTPIESDARRVADYEEPVALFWSTGHVLVRANALAAPAEGTMTLSADRYGEWVFPPVMRPPAGLHHAGDIVDLHPDGTAIASGYVVLSVDPFEDQNASRVYTFNRDILQWEALPTIAEPDDQYKLRASLSHFSTYAVLSPNPAIVVPPPPPPDTPAPPKDADGLSGGEIAGLVIGMLVLLALFLAFCFWFIQRRNRELFGDQKPLVSPPDPEPQPEPQEPPAGDWLACRGCTQPVRSDWPRCPNCHTPIAPAAPAEEPDSGAGVVATVGFEEPTTREIDLSQVDVDRKLEEFSATCWQCHAPIKPSWPRCPACKAPANPEELPAEPGLPPAEQPIDGFTMDCTVCHAPVKPTWQRCPTCRTPIAAPTSPPPEGLFGLQDDVAEHYARDAALNMEDQESVGELQLQDEDASHYPVNVPLNVEDQENVEQLHLQDDNAAHYPQFRSLSGLQQDSSAPDSVTAPVFGGELEGLQDSATASASLVLAPTVDPNPPVFGAMPGLQSDSALHSAGESVDLAPTVDPNPPVFSGAELQGLQGSQPPSVSGPPGLQSDSISGAQAPTVPTTVDPGQPVFSGADLQGLQSDSAMHSQVNRTVATTLDPGTPPVDLSDLQSDSVTHTALPGLQGLQD